jgi:hypothetical protein
VTTIDWLFLAYILACPVFAVLAIGQWNMKRFWQKEAERMCDHIAALEKEEAHA